MSSCPSNEFKKKLHFGLSLQNDGILFVHLRTIASLMIMEFIIICYLLYTKYQLQQLFYRLMNGRYFHFRYMEAPFQLVINIKNGNTQNEWYFLNHQSGNCSSHEKCLHLILFWIYFSHRLREWSDHNVQYYSIQHGKWFEWPLIYHCCR